MGKRGSFGGKLMGTVLIAIAVFVIIIIVHELGHFITAKLFKVPVPEFSIGFGPIIFSKKGEFTTCGVFDKSSAKDEDEIRRIADYYIKSFEELL